MTDSTRTTAGLMANAGASRPGVLLAGSWLAHDETIGGLGSRKPCSDTVPASRMRANAVSGAYRHFGTTTISRRPEEPSP